jgi:DNA repair protein RadC
MLIPGACGFPHPARRFSPFQRGKFGLGHMIPTSPSTVDLLTTLTSPAIAHVLISRYGTLAELAKAPIEELQTVPGIGPRKSQQLQSAFELARSLSRELALEQPLMDTPERVASLFREEAKVATVEVLYALLLNTRLRLIKMVAVSHGTLDGVMADARSVFRSAVSANASKIMLIHFHPSGDCTPSDADVRVTRDLIRAGQLLKIEVTDHVVMGRATTERPQDYASLREMGFFFS